MYIANDSDSEFDISVVPELSRVDGLTVTSDFISLHELLREQICEHCELAFRSDGARIDVVTSSRADCKELPGLVEAYLCLLRSRGFKLDQLGATQQAADLIDGRFVVKVSIAGPVDSGELYIQNVPNRTALTYLKQHIDRESTIRTVTDLFEHSSKQFVNGLSVKPGDNPTYSCIFQRSGHCADFFEFLTALPGGETFRSDIEICHDQLLNEDEKVFLSVQLPQSAPIKRIKIDYPAVSPHDAADLTSTFNGISGKTKFARRAKLLDRSEIDYFGVVFGPNGVEGARTYYI